jgi:hypothetical protein
METQFTTIPHLIFKIPSEKIDMFTSILQAGIKIPTHHGNSIGVFLEALPGFTTEYITDAIQTIFLNGTATDDLETPLDGINPVLAISAAMPGLAGAIFRKNSLHAALRTTKEKEVTTRENNQLTVTLKLFNSIARDRGALLLYEGIVIEAEQISRFLDTRNTLPPLIQGITLEDTRVPAEELLQVLSSLKAVHLTIVH